MQDAGSGSDPYAGSGSDPYGGSGSDPYGGSGSLSPLTECGAAGVHSRRAWLSCIRAGPGINYFYLNIIQSFRSMPSFIHS